MTNLRNWIAGLVAEVKREAARVPFRPGEDDWRETFDMLCPHCELFEGGCSVIEGMIALKDGGAWPEGGWVTDPGSGVT